MRIAAIESHCWANFDSKRPAVHKAVATAEKRIAKINQGLENALAATTATEADPGAHALYITDTGWARCKFCSGRAKATNYAYWTKKPCRRLNRNLHTTYIDPRPQQAPAAQQAAPGHGVQIGIEDTHCKECNASEIETELYICSQCDEPSLMCMACNRYYTCAACGLDICSLCYAVHPGRCGELRRATLRCSGPHPDIAAQEDMVLQNETHTSGSQSTRKRRRITGKQSSGSIQNDGSNVHFEGPHEVSDVNPHAQEYGEALTSGEATGAAECEKTCIQLC